MRRGRPMYQYAVSGVRPRLLLRALDIHPSRLVALAVFWALVTLLAWFFVDLRFYVYEAEVQGNALVSAEQVYRAGHLHSMSIFYIDRQQVAQEIRRQIPGVVQAQVECQLPGRVRVHIREQDVRFVWYAAHAAFLVDGEGRVLKADDGAHSGVISIQDLDGRPLQPGDQVDRVALNAASRLHSLLPAVATFEYSKAKGVSLSDARGWRVYFGDDQALNEKVATMHALLQKVAREGRSVKVIDLRFVQSPYYQ